jgi:ornithine cyclodeaminase/alanine dehydrogenase-like protein (mu-crystallin family)
MRLLTEADIRTMIDARAALEGVKAGFIALARGEVTTPAPIEVDFPHQDADLHVKGAFVADLPHFSFKVICGFYENPARGLPVTSGVSLLFDAETGAIEALLFDNGFLTDLRTAAAGALAADLLARSVIDTIGLIGTGTQARFQLEALLLVRRPRRILLFGRTSAHASAFAAEAHERHGLPVDVANSVEDVCRQAQLIVTATTARQPLVRSQWLQPGVHLTAMGADLPEKQELDPAVLAEADVVCADLLSQCLHSGEIHHAVASGDLDIDRVVELGPLAAGLAAGRQKASDITVADLTGVGVQDVAVASVVGRRLRELGEAAPGLAIETGQA